MRKMEAIRAWYENLPAPRRFYLAALGLALLLEIFLCNFQFFRTLGCTEQVFPLMESWTGQRVPENVTRNHLSESENMLRMDAAGDVSVEIRNLDLPAKNVHLDFREMRIVSDYAAHEALDFEIWMIDESHNAFYTRGGAATVSPSVARSQYIPIYPMGNLKALRIVFQGGQEGTQLRLPTVSINRPQPLFFSVLRAAFLFGMFCLCYHLRYGSGLYAVFYDPSSVRQRRFAMGAVIVYGAVVLVMAGYCQEASRFWSRNPYDLLAHAMSRGEVSLETEMPADERLIALEDPYNPSNREGIPYTWDCAFYEGKYYVYYGVTPELLLYLPHYLLTGKDFGVTTPARIELALLIAGIYFLFVEMSKRFRPIPFATWLLLLLAVETGMQTILLARVPIFYNIPVIMALVMTVWGLYFWLSAVRKREDGTADYSALRIAAGSVCMALVAGCRPQMVLGSALAIPIFMGYFDRTSRNRRTVRQTARYLLCGALPFVLYGAFLMWYNAARFGNPFEFGARYNLTSIDVTRVGMDAGKWVPGLFRYLFQPPRVAPVFPFLQSIPLDFSYHGDFFTHDSYGGFLLCNPILLVFFYWGLRRWKHISFFSHRLLISLSAGIALLITLINLMIGGFMPRYFCDAAPFFFTACLPLAFSVLNRRQWNVESGLPRENRASDWLLPLLSVLCVASVFYHYFTFYYTDGGAMLNRYDRDVFVRSAVFWQWWN